MKAQSLIFSTIFLAVINILIRILGFLYRILLVRLMGSEGLGLLELITPVTSLIGTMVGSGVPIAMIRLTTQSLAKNKLRQSFKTIEYTAWIMILFSLFLSIFLYINTPFIATNILKDKRLITPLKIFSPIIVFPSLSALLRGYFYGSKNVIPPAFSQLGEQVIRMIIVISLLHLLCPFQEDKAISISMLGNIFGEIIGMLILIIFFVFTKKKFKKEDNEEIPKVSFLKTLFSFGSIAIPITFSRMVSSLLRVATSIIVPGRLMASGLDQSTSLSLFGQINGMVIPLLFIPFTLTSALVMNLIPRISEAVETSNQILLHRYLDKTFHLTFLIGLPLSGIFYLFSNEIFSILYHIKNGLYLSQLSIVTLFLCIYQISASILQGIGKQFSSTITFIMGMFLQLILTYILVGNPKYQIKGYVFSYLISYIFIALINFFMVFYFTKDKMNTKEWILKPFISTVFALVFSKSAFFFLKSSFHEFVCFLICIIIFGILYFITLFLSKNIQSFFKE
ncbi:putative polysaccharide biosynthesis protein [Garciella nitratireducens]|uniref:putative polysaccharide biosynthesis protein n=1 Tax=Garciella nitratireducens TaxID=218205 RepID=UPI000DEA6650|nr:polysaccharide biosynthesis protein [Garciella nitratireducens]RBP46854.1 stage V sporulation protein B [Garciella nitratireducens]